MYKLPIAEGALRAPPPPRKSHVSSAESTSQPPQSGRTDKDLIKASNGFAQERRGRSWWELLSTLTFLGGWYAIAFLAQPWPVRALAGVLAGLMTVRMFIVFHDFKHGSILRGSRVAELILDVFGILALTPSKVWKQTHNYHHAHTAKIVGSHVGSYMMLTTQMWQDVTPAQRRMYRIVRHPLTILFGYLTVFLYGFCTAAFIRNPRKNKDSLLSILTHIGLTVVIAVYGGFETLAFAWLLPHLVAHAAGAYLFYAQHNFPEAFVQPREEWTFVRASLESSSYMKLGPVMNYFTGNIGYHHVHHLNHGIPFYRLPEAMAAIEELQHPRGVTSLSPRDIAACFRLKLWDAEAGKLVGFPSA